MICELLGLPLADRAKFSAWASGFTRLTGVMAAIMLIPNILAMRRYLEQHLEEVRKNGGKGLIAELVRVEKEGGQISRDELVSMVFLLLFAGHETTTHLIAGSVYELLKNPSLRDWLEEDWSRANPAVEEFLRFVSPVQFTKPRFVRKDVETGGVRLKEGEMIMPMWRRPTLIRRRIDVRTSSIWREGRTGISPSAPAFIFASAISWRVSKAQCALKALFPRWPKPGAGGG